MPAPKAITTTRPCPISGSSSALIVAERDRHGKELRNVISTESGLIFVDPVPFNDTEKFYRDDYRLSYKGVDEPRKKHIYRAGVAALRRLNRLIKYLPQKSRILDVGSSSGELLYLLKNRGYDCEGLEVNRGYAEFAHQELNIEATVTPVSQFATEKTYDVITMIHVLEHFENPLEEINHLAQFLGEKGTFIIEVPNVLSSSQRFLSKWHRGHLFSYSADTLAALFQKCGFEALQCAPVRDGGNLLGIFQKSSSPLSPTPIKESAEQILAALYTQRSRYYFRPRTWAKGCAKPFRNLYESFISRGKSARQILDSLYKDNS